jgi:phosphatidyl-myo-inositol dimannoside synthase
MAPGISKEEGRLPGCCFVVEARLERHGSLYWDPLQSYTAWHWQENLDVFGAVTVLARVRPASAAPPVRLSFPATVDIGEFPHYIGPLAALRHSAQLVRAARQWAQRDHLFILRGPGFLSILVWFWLCRQDKPYVVEVLGDLNEAHRFIRHPLSRLWRLFFGRMTQAVCRRAAAVMYVTRALSWVYPAHAEAMTAVVSDVRLTDEVYSQPRIFHTPPAPVRIIQVGYMEQPYKGYEFLLRALALCRQAGLAVQAVMVGDGRFRPTYERMAQEMGLGSVVSFTGAVPWGAPLFELLDRSDLFVLASLTEGLPKALLEAMARGLPAIGTAVGGVPELLTPETLVPPADAAALAERIQTLVGKPEELTRLSAHNFRTAHNYRHEVLSQRRKEFYRRVREQLTGSSPDC